MIAATASRRAARANSGRPCPAPYNVDVKTAKQELIETLDALPDDASMDDALERIRFKAKILHSMAQTDRGEGVPNEQVMEDLRR